MKTVTEYINEAIVKGKLKQYNNIEQLPYIHKNISIGFYEDDYEHIDIEQTKDKWESNKEATNEDKIKILQIINKFINNCVKKNIDYDKNKIEINFTHFEDFVDENTGDIIQCALFSLINNGSSIANINIDYINDTYYAHVLGTRYMREYKRIIKN